MTTPGPTIPKFHIKREAPPVADELSDDEVASPPRQSKFDLPKDALKRESVPTNFYFVESSKNYEIERHLQLFKRKADPAKTEHGAKKSKKDISDKKTPATIDMADLVRSNDALKRSNDEVVRSNKAVIAANENSVRASEALCKELRQATTTVNSALKVVSTVWQQYQKLLERDILLRQQDMRRRGTDGDDDEYDDDDDVPRISV